MNTASTTYPFDAYNGRTLFYDSDEVVLRKRKAFVRGAGFVEGAAIEASKIFPLLHGRRTEDVRKVNDVIIQERVSFMSGKLFKGINN